ncbi:hypothetical protein OUZ56_007500 [Daphnia magna]|uniref:Uncharacterized protein n=1 Tax=Daphnia magna TaxID=35525 RepID=A0ABR0AAC3_9CRUS|nr:hypothetical protein OUZ56_007500 [Daphnia magna]
MHANNVDNVKAGVPNCLAKLFAPLWAKETGRADTDDTNRVITEDDTNKLIWLPPTPLNGPQKKTHTKKIANVISPCPCLR